MLCGLAGSLRRDDIAGLMPHQPDYLGFRGALCLDHNRTAQLNRSSIMQIKHAIEENQPNSFRSANTENRILIADDSEINRLILANMLEVNGYSVDAAGDGAEALNRYQAAKRFVSLYRRFIGGDFYRCALDDTPRGNVVDLNVDYDTNEKQRAWLMAAMDSMDVKGVRPYFDALVTSVNTDGGPFWLDHLLAGSTDSRDRIFLDAAIQALDIIAPEIRPLGILVSVA